MISCTLTRSPLFALLLGATAACSGSKDSGADSAGAADGTAEAAVDAGAEVMRVVAAARSGVQLTATNGSTIVERFGIGAPLVGIIAAFVAAAAASEQAGPWV